MFDVKLQSQAAYAEHAENWKKHAKIHGKMPMHKIEELKNHGIGKAMVIVAMGHSLEKNIETLKENQSNVDILCCDKTLGILLDHGITPTYCLVADAKVDYKKYCHPWAGDKRIKDITLIMNVCANPDWSHNAKWKKIFFVVNIDAMGYEREFMALSGCPNKIVAGTNVSNAMVVFATQCEGPVRMNFLGYDKYILLGFDYCWTPDGHYYAFNKDGDGKSNYMRHIYCFDIHGEEVFTSQNLIQSAEWLSMYVKNYQLPAVNCSNNSLLSVKPNNDLKEQMAYSLDHQDAKEVQELDEELRFLLTKSDYVKNRLRELAEKHYYGFVATA